MATKKYLDYDGVAYFWEKIDARKQDKLVAGENVELVNDTINHTTTVNVDLSDKQDALTAAQLAAVNSGITSADKTKLDGIEAGAEVNVQSDWEQTDSTADDFIKNKPVIPEGAVIYQTTGQNTDGAMSQKATTDALDGKQDTLTAGDNIEITNNTISATDTTYTAGNGLNLSGTEFSVDTTVIATKASVDAVDAKVDTKQDQLTTTQLAAVNSGITSTDKTKLDGIEAGAEVNVQSDWAQTDTTADDFIKNKPEVYTKSEIDAKLTSAMHYKGTVATVAALPATAEVGDVYNVTETGDNYAWDGSAWDKLSGVVDLSAYYTKSEVDNLLANKQDELTAGDGILITNDTISADFTAITNPEIDAIVEGSES